MKRLLLFLLLISPVFAQEATLSGVYDLVITNGRVLDPASGTDAIRNIAIRGNKIVNVSERELRGRETIDATGLVVAPGFIDLNSHHLQTFGMRMQAYDGVTTVLDLESGRLPIGATYERLARAGRPLNYGVGASWAYAKIWAMTRSNGRPDGSLEYLTKTLSGGKVEWAGHSNEAQREELVRLVRDAVKSGALAISVDSRYVRDIDFSEVLALLELGKELEVVTFYRSYNDDLRGIGDLVALTLAVGGQTHLCQFNVCANANKAMAVAMLARARESGLKLSVSANPYGAESGLPRDFPGDKSELYYQDMRTAESGLERAKFKSLRREAITRHFLWTELVRGMSEEERENLNGVDQGRVIADKESLRQAVMLEEGVIASSATPWRYFCEQGSERSSKGVVHGRALNETHDQQWPPQLPSGVKLFADPRSSGTFTRVLRDWVAWDEPATEFRMTPLQAIEKMSLRPAQILEKTVPAMKTKGRLQMGMDADLIMFDPATLGERATYAEPAWHSVGMKYVVVNGQVLINNFEMNTQVLPGRPIRRPVTH